MLTVIAHRGRALGQLTSASRTWTCTSSTSPSPCGTCPRTCATPRGWVADPAAAAPRMETAPAPVAATWRAMDGAAAAGLAAHIGVSNFTTSLLGDLLASAAAAGLRSPECLQVELHAYAPLPTCGAELGIRITRVRRGLDTCMRRGLGIPFAFRVCGAYLLELMHLAHPIVCLCITRMHAARAPPRARAGT